MAYTQRQETAVKIGAYIYNGGYRAFEGYPVSLDVWNLDAKSVLEFQNGSPFVSALSGFEYSNAEAYRLMVSFDLANIYGITAQTAWQTLFNLLSSQSDRTFWVTTADGAGTGSTSLVLQSDASGLANDYFNGLFVTNLAGGEVRITDYDGGTRTATLASAKTWLNGAAITIKAKPNFPTLLGVSITNEVADLQYYNIENNAIGAMRELTINRQILNLRLRSVERVNSIPNSFIVNG